MEISSLCDVYLSVSQISICRHSLSRTGFKLIADDISIGAVFPRGMLGLADQEHRNWSKNDAMLFKKRRRTESYSVPSTQLEFGLTLR